MTDTERPLIELICEDMDAELAEITSDLLEAKIAARLAALALARNDLLEAAKQARLACDLEYGALGDCDYCGKLAEVIERTHVGSDADYCDASGCKICAYLNADMPEAV